MCGGVGGDPVSERLIFEMGAPRRGAHRPQGMEARVRDDVPAEHQRKHPPALPDVSDLELIRHYVRLSTLNFSVDGGFYPLGSCTMKYNPKIHERIAREPHLALAGADTHVYFNYSKSLSAAQETEALVREKGGQATAVAADVTVEEKVRDFFLPL